MLPLEIDGSHGEGGGQLLRTAVALAAVTGQEIVVRNIRARRQSPGLAPQHLAAVRAVAELCHGDTDALAGGGSSTTRTLTPHARTAMWLIERFLPIRFVVREAGALMQVLVVPTPPV